MAATSNSSTARRDGTGSGEPTALTPFCFMWAVTQLLDLFCFPDWVLHPSGIGLFLANVAVLLKPSSSIRFLAQCALNLVYLYARSPITPNHVLVEGFVNLTILVVVLRKRGVGPETDVRAAVFAEAAPLLRLYVCALYGFAFLHKLNQDFFLPDTGCGAFMLEGLAEQLPFIPAGQFARSIAPWAAVLCEGGVPLLLLFRRTRRPAFVLAWAFHFLLAFHPRPGIPAFSALVFALLALFLPAGFFEGLAWTAAARRLERGVIRLRRQIRWVIVAGGGFAVVSALILLFDVVDLRGAGLSSIPRLVALLLFVPYGLGCIFGLLVCWRHAASARPAPLFRRALRSPAFALVVLFAIQCMAPYLGLQTVRVMSMFSSLRTEGGQTNHLFIPSRLQIGGYQDELVEVVSSADPWLEYRAREHALVPYAEIRRVVWQDPGRLTPVVFRRGGQTFEITASSKNVETWLPPLPFPLHKILAFRAVDREGAARCRW